MTQINDEICSHYEQTNSIMIDIYIYICYLINKIYFLLNKMLNRSKLFKKINK